MHTNVISTSREVTLLPSFLPVVWFNYVLSLCRMFLTYAFPISTLYRLARVSNPVTMRPNIGYRIMHLLLRRAIETTSIEGREREKAMPSSSPLLRHPEVGIIEIVVATESKSAKTFPSVDVAAIHGIRHVSLKRQRVSGQRIRRPPFSERNGSFILEQSKKRDGSLAG